MEELKNFKFIKAKKPVDPNTEYMGRKVRCMDGKTYVIEKIVGSLIYPTRYEINHAHHVVILDFYAQMNGDKSVTPQMINDFDEIVFEVKNENSREKDVSSEAV